MLDILKPKNIQVCKGNYCLFRKLLSLFGSYASYSILIATCLLKYEHLYSHIYKERMVAVLRAQSL